MSFISYAPNFEDVILWRALGHIGKGFYVDAGAGGPHTDSVTRAFYERGWHGLNLQGARGLHAALLVARPADVNLQVIPGPAEGTVAFYDCDERSTLDQAQAEAMSAAGATVVKRHLAQQTLSALCAAHAPQAIHFMRIGFGASTALAGLDLDTCRPWVLLVCGERIEPPRYEHAYSDGLCHYYVAEEHPELRAAFAYPPSKADQFVLRQDHPFAYPLTEWRTQVTQLQAAKAAAEASAQEARDWAEARVREREQMNTDAIHRAEAVVRQFYEAAINDIYQSSSWRITRPLRSLTFRARAMRTRLRGWAARQRARAGGLRGGAARLVKGAVRRVVRAIMSRPKVSFFVRSQIGRHPRLTNWLRVIVQRTQAGPAPVSMESAADLDSLPASARQVLDDLRRTIHNTRN